MCWVNKFEGQENLVNEEFSLVILQLTRSPNHRKQIRIHRLENSINILKLGSRGRKNNLKQFNNIRMFEKPEHAELPQNSPRINFMFKNIGHFFNGDQKVRIVLALAKIFGKHYCSIGSSPDSYKTNIYLTKWAHNVVADGKYVTKVWSFSRLPWSQCRANTFWECLLQYLPAYLIFYYYL